MNETKLRRFEAFSEYQAEHPLAHELPYWDFMDNCVVLADGSLVSGLKLTGIAIDTLDTDELNQLTASTRSLLNSLPDGWEISFLVEVNSDYQNLVEAHSQLKGDKDLVSWVSDSRISAINDDIKAQNILKRSIYLFLYRRHLGEKSGSSLLKSFFLSPKQFQLVTKEQHESALKELLQVAEGLRTSLSSLGVCAEPLATRDVWNLIYRFLNPERSKTEPAPKTSHEYREQEFVNAEIKKAPGLAVSSPREQLVFGDLISGYDMFFCDGYYHRVITLKTLPEFTHSALVSKLMDLPFHYSLHVHVKVPEQSKELASLQQKRRMAHSMSMSHEGRATDLESEAKLHSAEELLREIINTGQKIFYCQLSILLRAKTKDELEMNTKTVLSKFRELNGAEALNETVGGFKVWKTVLPLGTTTLVRPKRIKTDNLADFLPLYQSFEGSQSSSPVCLFRNRSMGLVKYDPFDSLLPNYNTLVTGSSGSGKSFLNNLVLLQYVTQDPLVFIIDIGGSYRKLCEFLGGQYIEISPPRSNEACKSINPFELPAGSKEPSPQKIKFLLSLLENVLTDDEGDKLPKLHKSMLEEAIGKTYKTNSNRSPRMSDLAKTFSDSQDQTLRDFSRMLYPWTGDRPYGRLLDADNAINLSSDIVVFDLKGLSVYPDLQAVMILIITDFILGKVEHTPNRRKRILMDECWELLKSRGSANFMEYCVRTLRKTGSGITFITQGLEEIVASSIGPAILSNTATKFILLQRGDLEPIRTILKLNEQEMALISSLRQVKGSYSEAFLMANEARTVIRACPTPLEYWLATSDAADNALLEDRRKQQPEKTLAAHIHELANEYPFGAAGGKRK